MSTASIIAQIENVARVGARAAPMLETILPGPLAEVVAEGAALEPTAESAIALFQNLLDGGADHSGAAAAVGAIFTSIGQAFSMKAATLPPPTNAASPPVGAKT